MDALYQLYLVPRVSPKQATYGKYGECLKCKDLLKAQNLFGGDSFPHLRVVVPITSKAT